MKTVPLQEIKNIEEGLGKDPNFNNLIIDSFPDAFFILNRRGEFLKINSKAVELIGFQPSELQKMDFIDIIPIDDLSSFKTFFEEMQRGKDVRFQMQVLSQKGDKISVEFFGRSRGDYFFITLRDLRERMRIEEEWLRIKKELQDKIRERDQYARELLVMKDLFKEKVNEIEKMREEAIRLSYTDDLTGIYNHRFFIQQLGLEIERQKRYPSPLSLLMIDIDYFKHYNDKNGHLAGDQVLKAISILIQRGVRQTDIVARYGGEEFSAILINATWEKAMEIAERVRRLVSETNFPNEMYQPNGDLTVSIGVATFTPPVSTLTDLIRKADNALYRAKKAGRNRVEG